MTAKIVALYTRPGDSDAFDRHYFATHMPLVNRVPGLQRVETARFVAAADAGEQTYYRITELYFADPGAAEAAFGTDEGKAAAADYQNIAPGGVEAVHRSPGRLTAALCAAPLGPAHEACHICARSRGAICL